MLILSLSHVYFQILPNKESFSYSHLEYFQIKTSQIFCQRGRQLKWFKWRLSSKLFVNRNLRPDFLCNYTQKPFLFTRRLCLPPPELHSSATKLPFVQFLGSLVSLYNFLIVHRIAGGEGR